MSNAYSEIEHAMAFYFDGFYEGNIDTLKRVFHPHCHLYSATTGKIMDDNMEAVYDRVAGREAPAKRGELRADRIISINFSDAVTALVTVQIGIGDKLFTDYLNFVKLHGEWKIIAKVYTFVMREIPLRSRAA